MFLKFFFFLHEFEPVHLLLCVKDKVRDHTHRQALVVPALGAVLALPAIQWCVIQKSLDLTVDDVLAVFQAASLARLADPFPLPVLGPSEEGSAGVAGDRPVVHTHLHNNK